MGLLLGRFMEKSSVESATILHPFINNMGIIHGLIVINQARFPSKIRVDLITFTIQVIFLGDDDKNVSSINKLNI